MSTLAGDKNETEVRHRDGPALQAVFGAPVGLGLDALRQTLYVADRWGTSVSVSVDVSVSVCVCVGLG